MRCCCCGCPCVSGILLLVLGLVCMHLEYFCVCFVVCALVFLVKLFSSCESCPNVFVLSISPIFLCRSECSFNHFLCIFLPPFFFAKSQLGANFIFRKIYSKHTHTITQRHSFEFEYIRVLLGVLDFVWVVYMWILCLWHLCVFQS